jgi:hypothetical protein
MTAQRRMQKRPQHDFRGPGVLFERCIRCGRSSMAILGSDPECISDAAAAERAEFAAAADAAANQMLRLRRARH